MGQVGPATANFKFQAYHTLTDLPSAVYMGLEGDQNRDIDGKLINVVHKIRTHT